MNKIRQENNHLALAIIWMLLTKDCHKPIFLLPTANLYNTVFRQDQACLIKAHAKRIINTLIVRFVNLTAYSLQLKIF
jgi:hypothetical protein